MTIKNAKRLYEHYLKINKIIWAKDISKGRFEEKAKVEEKKVVPKNISKKE